MYTKKNIIIVQNTKVGGYLSVLSIVIPSFTKVTFVFSLSSYFPKHVKMVISRIATIRRIFVLLRMHNVQIKKKEEKDSRVAEDLPENGCFHVVMGTESQSFFPVSFPFDALHT